MESVGSGGRLPAKGPESGQLCSSFFDETLRKRGKEPRHVLLLIEARQRLLRRVADVRNREVVDLDGQVNPYHRAVTAALDQQPRPRHGRRGARIGNLHGDPASATARVTALRTGSMADQSAHQKGLAPTASIDLCSTGRGSGNNPVRLASLTGNSMCVYQRGARRWRRCHAAALAGR